MVLVALRKQVSIIKNMVYLVKNRAGWRALSRHMISSVLSELIAQNFLS